MAVTADRVIVELEAKLDKYEANVRRAEQKFDRATKQIGQHSRRMEREISQNSDAVGARFRALAATFAAAFSARQVAALADSYTRFTNQLAVAGVEGANLARVQNELFDVAQANGVALESLGSLYGRVTQSAGELGATQADILKLTEGVAAGLRVQGASAEQASGAILGLVQALGSTNVKAEEFNQINEGAPALLRGVAANIDEAGGSVSRLRALVVDGQITNKEFFDAFLAGTDQLKAQAEEANLTIANSFTVLNNALGKFIGEADESLSATEKISQAIIALSENLDTVVKALGVVSAVLLGRFVAGTVAGGAGLTTLSAYASVATTSLAGTALAARSAGAALVTALGGPVGIAVTSLAIGLTYLATETETAAERIDRLSNSADNAETEADAMERRLREAGVAMYDTETASDAAAGGFARAGTAARAASGDLYQLEQQAIRTATALIDAQLQENTARSVALGREQRRADAVSRSPELAQRDSGIALRGRQAERDAEREALDREFKALTRQRNAIITGIRDGVDVRNDAPPPPRPATPESGAGKKTGGGGSRGPSPEEIRQRFLDEIARGQSELAAATADAIGTAEARRQAERLRIEIERDAIRRSLENDENYDAAQKEQLIALNDQIAAARLEAIAAEAAAEAAEDALYLRTEALRTEQDLLRAQARLAETSGERRTIELRLLDLQYEEERLRLEAIANNEQLNAAEREAARRRLASLDERQETEREGVERDTAGPMERYKRGLDKSPEEIAEEAEQWMVEELNNIQNKLSGAIQDKLGVKDPILGGIIDLFIEQVIMKPLADAFSNASSAQGGFVGAFIQGIGSLFSGGRASGGHVSAGRLYQVNEQGVEGFQPAGSGKIIPLGRMRGAQGGGVVINQTVKVDASGSVNPTGYAEHIKQAVRQETMAIVGEGMKRVNAGVPARLAQYQRDGN